MRAINLIVLHCSASPNGVCLIRSDPATGKIRMPVEVIDDWHKQRGFLRGKLASAKFNPTLGHIGYHYVIYVDGTVATGRAEDEVGAHAKGFNAQSLGVCLVGTDRYHDAQWRSLSQLLAALKQRYPQATVVGHRDLSPDADGDGTVEPREWLKTCPGFDVAAYLHGGYRASTAHVLEG